MTIHHTAVVLGNNSNAPARLRQHQQYHQDSQGWIDIAYHIGVDRNGNIFELRKPETLDEPIERVRAAYGDANFERLRQVKRRYDPHNLFRFNHNIPPAEA